ncbi:MAG: plastocyanin/azurin family copper-binding protein [Dokdonella sp.]
MNRYCILAMGAFALAATVPAFATDHQVAVGGSGLVFTPQDLPPIAVGDTVTFTNAGGFHNVVSDPGAVTSFRCANGCDGDGAGGNGNASSAGWTATVTFPTAGTIGYHCQIHQGSGMVGTITVMPATGSPTIGTDQTSLSGTAEAGATAAATFAIMNTGTADLTWNVDTATADCATPDSVPWITLAPVSGTVAVGADAATVNVTLDSASLDIGVHSANVCIHNNDPAHDPLTLPVQFTVTTVDLIFKDGFDG